MRKCQKTCAWARTYTYARTHKRKRTDSEHEVVEGLVVEVVESDFHCQGKVCQV